MAAPTKREDRTEAGQAGRSFRFWLMAFAATLAVITYVDRVCISQAAPLIQRDLGLSAWQMGLAFSAFSLAYAIFEIPGGWLGDRIGPVKVLTRVVVFWSAFTAATGYVWNLVSLLVARFCFGAGEAGCFPNLTKAFALWLPEDARARAQGIMWLSARWGGAFTPLLVIWVMTVLSWRLTFVVFGLLGVIWAVFFRRWTRRNRLSLLVENASGAPDQAQAPGQTAPALTIPWRRLLRSSSIWLLWLQYFCLTYGWFFYVTWMPTYLQEARGTTLSQNPLMTWLQNALAPLLSPEMTAKTLVAALAAIPLFIGGLGAILSGFITPWLGETLGSVARARRALALTGFAGASAMLVWSYYIQDPLAAMLAMGAAAFANDLTMPGSWSACVDIGGRYAATLAGAMNMMGSIGAALAPLIIGVILDLTNRNWAITFWMSGIIYFAGGLCWLGIKPVKSGEG